MRIGFDARILTVPKCGGVAYFTRLLRHLPAVDEKIELVLFLPGEPLEQYAGCLAHKQITLVPVPGGARDLSRWPAAHMPALLKKHRIDIYHQPFNADGPFFRAPCPVVVSILDLIPWVIPGSFRKPLKALRYKLRNMLWAHTAARVLTISDASRRDIVRLCRVPERQVVTTHLGADAITDVRLSASEEDEVLTRLDLAGKRYIVNMGGFNQQRRNPDFIISGFAQFRRQYAQDVWLVVTGSILRQDGFFERVRGAIAAAGIEDRVIVTGFLSDRDLKAVLSRAEVSVVTSLYEGFCLPLTESFACGVPSIANDRGSVPEIAGDAALLVDPARPDLLAQRLQELCASSSRREEFRSRGLKRVRCFDWHRTAQETYAVYTQAVQSRGCL